MVCGLDYRSFLCPSEICVWNSIAMCAKVKVRARKKSSFHVFSLTSFGKSRGSMYFWYRICNIRAFKILLSTHQNRDERSKKCYVYMVKHENFSQTLVFFSGIQTNGIFRTRTSITFIWSFWNLQRHQSLVRFMFYVNSLHWIQCYEILFRNFK